MSVTRQLFFRALYGYTLDCTLLSLSGHKQHFLLSGGSSCSAQFMVILLEKKARSVTSSPFNDRAPTDDCVTPYDERHFVTYLRLLDAFEEGADWREAVSVIFGLDAALVPERARLVYDSHLKRSRWMTEQGYRHLLETSRDA